MNPQRDTTTRRQSGLKQVVLKPDQQSLIADVVSAVKRRRTDSEPTLSRALTILFSGRAGTGKTLAAEVLAAELRLKLYKVDISSVVSKYIGETEKNLRRLLGGAQSADVILFLDEAEELFGRRTDVKDSHDRYADLEVQHLFKTIEEYDGITILSMARREHIDQTILERTDIVVDFPEHEATTS
jgi:SpoVK/Ycf46/Vps4 family AAA+-type ATPase